MKDTMEQLKSLVPPDFCLYTDGSSWSVDRSGGWAWLAFDYFGSEASAMGSASDTTNNRMEMMGWIEGLRAIYEAHGPCCILVFSDSQYVGYGFRDSGRQRHANSDLWERLVAAVEQHEFVEFHHVKGHGKGEKYNRFNHMVDEMAGQARRAGQNEET
jgi:ribonuclease HI